MAVRSKAEEARRVLQDWFTGEHSPHDVAKVLTKQRIPHAHWHELMSVCHCVPAFTPISVPTAAADAVDEPARAATAFEENSTPFYSGGDTNTAQRGAARHPDATEGAGELEECAAEERDNEATEGSDTDGEGGDGELEEFGGTGAHSDAASSDGAMSRAQSTANLSSFADTEPDVSWEAWSVAGALDATNGVVQVALQKSMSIFTSIGCWCGLVPEWPDADDVMKADAGDDVVGIIGRGSEKKQHMTRNVLHEWSKDTERAMRIRSALEKLLPLFAIEVVSKKEERKRRKKDKRRARHGDGGIREGDDGAKREGETEEQRGTGNDLRASTSFAPPHGRADLVTPRSLPMSPNDREAYPIVRPSFNFSGSHDIFRRSIAASLDLASNPYWGLTVPISSVDVDSSIIARMQLTALGMATVSLLESVLEEALLAVRAVRELRGQWEVVMTSKWFWWEQLPSHIMQSIKGSKTPREHLEELRSLERHLLGLLGGGSRALAMFQTCRIEHEDGYLMNLPRLSAVIFASHQMLQHFLSFPIRNIQNPEIRVEWFGMKFAAAASRSVFRALSLYNVIASRCGDAVEFAPLVNRVVEKNMPPGHMARYWVRYAIAGIGIFLITRWVVNNTDTIIDAFDSFYVTSKKFIRERVEKPVKKIYKTIRYDETDFEFSSEDDVVKEIESLSRMVMTYNARKGLSHVGSQEDLFGSVDAHPYTWSDEDIEELVEERISLEDQKPDFGGIRHAYETEMMTPFQSLFFGDLATLFLMQIQKQKVEMAQAMMALSKLMRSNEITFQIVAVVPAIVVALVLSRQLISFAAVPRQLLAHQASVRMTVRDVHRHLNRCSSKPEHVPMGGDMDDRLVYVNLVDAGELLVLVDELRGMASSLPRNDRYHFIQDIHELQSEQFSVSQKIETVNRMWRTYSFLTAPPM